MKKLFFLIYSKLPFKKEVCFFIKMLGTPSKRIYRMLYFEGVFTVKHRNRSYFKIKNYNYLYIEKCLFWKGLFGEWEKTSLKLWEELCKDSDVIFDIGANTGVYSLLAKTTNPNSKVYAFEPIERVYEKLDFNVMLNDFDIACLQKAVSNKDGNSVIYDNNAEHTTTASLNSSTSSDDDSTSQAKNIEVIRLDSFIKDQNIDRIDLLKIDVETFEVEVLEGFRKNLQKFQPVMLIEILTDSIARGIQEIIADINYDFYNIDESGAIRKVSSLTRSNSYNFLLCKPEISEKINHLLTTE